MLLIDDLTRATWIVLLKEKLETFKHFKKFKAQVENEKYLNIKLLRLERGGEYNSSEFEELYEKHNILTKYSVARTPQQNGLVERKNRTIQEMVRAMLDEAGMPQNFWGEAAREVVYISNETQLRRNSDRNPYDLWNGRHVH